MAVTLPAFEDPGEPVRVAVVTGAAGVLGTALVQQFIAAGYRVAAGMHRARIDPAPGVWPVPLDVTRSDEVNRTIDTVRQRWGRIDALVNNAGTTADRLVATLADSDWDTVLQVNLRGAAWCARAVAPVMQVQGAGHILNVSSYSGRHGQPGQAHYAAAKAGLVALTQSLARELGPAGICVNAVLPGLLDSPMTGALPESVRQKLIAENVLGKPNTPAEVAACMVFLCSLQQVSGQVFHLDSRITAWA